MSMLIGNYLFTIFFLMIGMWGLTNAIKTLTKCSTGTALELVIGVWFIGIAFISFAKGLWL